MTAGSTRIHLRSSRSRYALAGAIASVWGLLTLSSVGAVVAARSLGLMLLTTVVGLGVLEVLDRTVDRQGAWAVALALPIGCAWLGIAAMFAGWFAGDQMVWWAICLSLPPMIVGVRPIGRMIATPSALAARGAWLTIAAGLLALAHDWIWTAPLAGVVLSALWFLDRRPRTSGWAIGCGMLALAGSVIGLVGRADRWWFSQNDQYFSEALITSLSRLGPSANLLAYGRSLSYHWLTYGLGAVGTIVTGASPDAMASRILPVLAVLGSSGLVVTMMHRFIAGWRGGALIILWASSPVFGDWSTGIRLAMAGSLSQLFGLMWLVALVAVLCVAAQGMIGTRSTVVLVALLCGASSGGKVTHGVVAVGLTAILAVMMIWRRDPQRWSVACSAVGGASLSLLVVARVTPNAGGARVLPFDWVPYVQGEFAVVGRGESWLAGALMLVGLLIAPLLAASGWGGVEPERSSLRQATVGLLAVCAVLTVISNRAAQSGPNGLFILHSAVVLAWLHVTAAVVAPGSTALRSLGVRVGVVGALVIFLIPNPASGSEVARWLRVLPTPALIGVPIAATLAARSRRGDGRTQRATALIAVTTTIVVLQVTMLARSAPREYRAWQHAADDRASSPDHVATVAEWIRRNVPEEGVYATNHLCDSVACASPELSADARFVSLVERPTLLAAPLYSLTYSVENEGTAVRDGERVAISMEFGVRPTRDLAATLRAAGVRWYVAERARSEGVDFSDVGDVRYENADYLVVELRDP